MATRLQSQAPIEDEPDEYVQVEPAAPKPVRRATPRKTTRKPSPPARKPRSAGTRRDAAARPSLAGRPDSRRPSRQLGSAGRVVVIGSVCFGLWLFAAAPALLRTAEASPLGARRTAAVAVLRPLARLTAFFGIDRLGSGIDRLLGRQEEKVRTLPPIPMRQPLLEPSHLLPQPPRHKRGSKILPFAPQLLAQYRAGGEKLLKAKDPFGLPVPTKAHPLSIITVGDSLADDLGNGLARYVAGREGFDVRTDAHVATGLARQDFFNWPYHLALDVRQYRPDVVVALFGVNDPMNGFFIGSHGIPFGTQEWAIAYRARVAKVMTLITKSHRPLLWVGMPVVADARRESGVQFINAIFREEARRHPGVVYVDAWKLFADSRGHYSAYMTTSSGAKQLVRLPDGVHLTPAGGDQLAKAVYQAMSGFWRTPGYGR